MIKRKKINAAMERQIVIGLAVSDDFVAQCAEASVIQYDLFNVRALAQAAKWCIEFYEEFGRAPKTGLSNIYAMKVEAGAVPETYEDEYEILLSGLSRAYVKKGKAIDSQLLIKQAVQYMRRRKLQALGTRLMAVRDDTDLIEAEGLIGEYTSPAVQGTLWSDPFSLNEQQLKEVYEPSNDYLFQMPGALGKFLGPEERGTFTAIQGPEKKGKTFWLWEYAIRARLAQNNVAFFSVADMSESQNWRRVHGWMLKSSRKYEGRSYRLPVLDCLKQQRGECGDTPAVLDKNGNRTFTDIADYTPCTDCKDKPDFEGGWWHKQIIVPAFDLSRLPPIQKRFVTASGGATTRQYCSTALTVAEIRNQLMLWDRLDGWKPNVVGIDYADVMAPEPGTERLDPRHQINATWAAMRKLSLDFNIALYTGTQAKDQANTKAYQDVTDTSEDKRKKAHVTRLLGLNQLPMEKRNGLMRINSLIEREGFYDTYTSVVCLQWLPCSRPLMGSYIHYGQGKEKE